MIAEPMGDHSDEQLLSMYVRGRQRGFEALVSRHGTDVKAYALRVLRSPEQAEEVYVEAFTKLARQAPRWQRRGTVRGFLFTAAHHHCMDILRRRKTEREASPQLIDLERSRTFQPSPEARAMLGELADELERAIAELPDAHRQVLLLRAVHGLSAREVGEITGLQPGQVDSKFSYARKELRVALAAGAQPAQDEKRRRS